MKQRDGIALIFVLWVMVLLSALALEMAFRGRLRVQETVATAETTKAFFIARAGVEKCIADLANDAGTVEEQDILREDAEAIYVNAPLGEGTYTIYAGMDEDGIARYGMVDESSKLNINTVDVAVLEKLPELGGGLAAAIVAIRGQEPFRDLKDLLQIEGVDPVTLYGEDQNENGLLDANENDGDQSWPPDNADGWLDGGLSQYLTTYSVSRNISANGDARANLNEDDAESITQAIKEISQQQADSIVAQREKGQFASVLDLLEVELVEKTTEQPNEGDRQAGNQEAPSRRRDRTPRPEPKAEETEKKPSSEGDTAKQNGNEKTPEQENEPKESEKPEGSSEGPKVVTKGTGQKAFDETTVRKIADLTTTSKDEVRPGQINVNTAPYQVLACLPGMDESLALAVVREREARAGGFATVVDLLDVNGMTTAILKQCFESLTARSEVFTVRSYGVLEGGAVHVGVSAVLDRSDDEIRIVRWQEHE
jgi:DNA uptake protein ComE-like DNA-binding protein